MTFAVPLKIINFAKRHYSFHLAIDHKKLLSLLKDAIHSIVVICYETPDLSLHPILFRSYWNWLIYPCFSFRCTTAASGEVGEEDGRLRLMRMFRQLQPHPPHIQVLRDKSWWIFMLQSFNGNSECPWLLWVSELHCIIKKKLCRSSHDQFNVQSQKIEMIVTSHGKW